jgi:hypothetical protein
MIYVRIEMWPHGDKSRARILSEATIANVGGDATHGNYEAMFSKVGGFKSDVRERKPKATLRAVLVKDFPRKRLYAADLLLRALVAAFGERNAVK